MACDITHSLYNYYTIIIYIQHIGNVYNIYHMKRKLLVKYKLPYYQNTKDYQLHMNISTLTRITCPA